MAAERVDYKTYYAYSNLVGDYLNPELNHAYFPGKFSLRALSASCDNRPFSHVQRIRLYESIKQQYAVSGIDLNGEVARHVEGLKEDNCFTITTGHQLNLLTGPLYFIIKILQVIKIAEILNERRPDMQVVPLFWMATEDHDFEEINHAHLFGKTITWPDAQGGKVGAYKTQSLHSIFPELFNLLGQGEHADTLHTFFKKSYLEHENLAKATRYLVHSLFSSRGLVIIDGDDKELKRDFIPYFKKEIVEKVLNKEVGNTVQQFESNYKVQVNPRPLNIFYLQQGSRSLIEEENGRYQLKDKELSWNQEELLTELQSYPERFSPNVILRPMFQERILPNLCYVGGPGEIAYWLELKSSFKAFELPMPLLNLRNSIMWLDEVKLKKLNKLGLNYRDLFLEESEINRKLADFETVESSLDDEISTIKAAYDRLSDTIAAMDASLKSYVLAEGKKNENQLEQMKSRLLKAKKARNEERLSSYWNLFEKVFPGGNLHERYDNFVPYFLKYGWSFFDQIYDGIDPEDFRLMVMQDVK